MKFQDQVVLVTGGGTGIGRATARAFAEEGATVVVAGRTEKTLAETVELIGGRAGLVTADVTDEADAARMVATVVDRYGRLDVAFNNAGVAAGGKVADLDKQAWDHVMTVNVTAASPAWAPTSPPRRP